MRTKLSFLPQISAPYTEVLQKLDNKKIGYEIIKANPDELHPIQGIVFSDKVGNVNFDDTNPIWISNDNSIVDGHHRMVRALVDGLPIKAVRINLNTKDTCRILNRIQDIYDYEKSKSIEEVEQQNTINYFQDDENQFLNMLEEDNFLLQNEKDSKNRQMVIAYRKDPIKENSSVGNFFTLIPIDGYDKYEISFDNLFDTDMLGISYEDGLQVMEVLSKCWFPHVNFEKLGERYNVLPINLRNKAITEKAMKIGYDGIKYGKTIIQGLK